eukprot:jgi/Tetstr1/463849/TSEL_008663.t1
MDRSRIASAPLQVNGRRLVQVDNSSIQLRLDVLAAATSDVVANVVDVQNDSDSQTNAVWFDQARQDAALDLVNGGLAALSKDVWLDQARQDGVIDSLAADVAAIDVTAYISRSEKPDFQVGTLRADEITPTGVNMGVLVSGHYFIPRDNGVLGILSDLGTEGGAMWRHVYADGLTLANTESVVFNEFQGAQGEYTLGDIMEYAISLVPQHPTSGPQGNFGATGPQGSQGNADATGPQGPQRLKGDDGVQGPKGDDGVQWAAGTTLWSAITAPSGWVSKFSYEDKLAFTYYQYAATAPPANYDIAASDSITPTSESTYNIGHAGKSLETPLLNVISIMSLNGNRITQVGAPTTGTDVVNKSYVDAAISAALGS